MQLDEKVKSFCQKEYANLTNNQALPLDAVKSPIRKISGQLQNGRWTREEHIRFVEGLSLYGKNWKQVEDHVQTRSGAQIRSHAQKFFNRLEREYAKKQTEQQQQEMAGQGNQKYNFRKRFSSFDSTASYDAVSEEQEEKVSQDKIKQIVPQENQQKRDIKGWIQYYHEEKQKLLKNLEDPNKRNQQQKDNLQKINGIIQLLSAYENIQDLNHQQITTTDSNKNNQNLNNTNSLQNPENKETSPSSSKKNQNSNQKTNKQPQVITLSSSFLKWQAQQNLLKQFTANENDAKNQNQSIEEQILSQQHKSTPKKEQTQIQDQNEEKTKDHKFKGIAHDESFFHFVLKRYWNSINPTEDEKNIKLSQLVDLGDEQNESQKPLGTTNYPNKKRKSSFAINENGTEEEKEIKLEKLRKLVKCDTSHNNSCTKLSPEHPSMQNLHQQQENIVLQNQEINSNQSLPQQNTEQ